MKDRFKKEFPILVILIIGFTLRIIALINNGAEYGLSSDDLSYVNAAITFVETGKITMHGVLSAQIMPGMIWLLAPFVLVFGTGYNLWLSIKLLWIIMGTLSMYGMYKVVTIKTDWKYGIIAALFMLAPDFIWTDNLILTETPFILASIFLLYNSIMLADTRNNKYFWYICFWYMFALLLKANIAPYPLFLFLYLWLKKYDMKLMVKQMFIAIGVLFVFWIPWTVRNYIQFDHKFIPLTYGAGNPKLLGSYQGKYVPNDADLDYYANVYSKMPEEMKVYYNDDGSLKEYYDDDKVWAENYMAKYYALELDDMKANYRISEWRKNNLSDYLFSLFVSKPKTIIFNSFYWKEGVFNIPVSFNFLLRKIDLVLFIIGSIAILLNRKLWKEWLLIVSFFAFEVLVYAYTFAFDRYSHSLHLFRFVIIGWGLSEGIKYIKKKRQQLSKE